MADKIVPATNVANSAPLPTTSIRGCLLVAGLTVGRLCVHLFAIIVALSFLCSGFPVAWKLFLKEGLKVPEPTILVYGWYRAATDHWALSIPAFLLFLLFDAVLLVWLESRSERWRWLARFWFSLILVASLAFVGFVFAAAIVPISTLVPLPEGAYLEDTPNQPVELPANPKN